MNTWAQGYVLTVKKPGPVASGVSATTGFGAGVGAAFTGGDAGLVGSAGTGSGDTGSADTGSADLVGSADTGSGGTGALLF